MAIVCPKCRQSNVRRSHRRPADFIFRVLGMAAFRCNVCDHRFFRFRNRVRPHQDPGEDVHDVQHRSF
jgi:transposase-like protein